MYVSSSSMSDHKSSFVMDLYEEPATSKRSIMVSLSIVVVTCIALVCIGLMCGLIGFFVLRDQEMANALNQVKTEADIRSALFSVTISNAIRSVRSLGSIFSIGAGRYYDQFDPFITQSQINVQGVFSLQWVPRVDMSQRDIFTLDTRSIGLEFSNFTIRAPDVGGKAVEAPLSNEYYVVTYVFPYATNKNALGLDMQSNVDRNQTLQRAKLLKSESLTPRIILVNGNVPGCIIFSPVYNSTELIGFSLGVIRVPEIVSSSSSSSYGHLLTIYDEGIAYDNVTKPFSKYNATQLISSSLVDTVDKYKECAERLTASPFYVDKLVKIADRTWRLVFTPSDQILTTHQRADKWLVLFLSIAGTVFIGFIVLVTALSLFIRENSRKEIEKANREKVSISEQLRSETSELLNRIANKSSIIKGTLNSLKDALIIVDEKGRIYEHNERFETMFSYNKTDIDSGLHTREFLTDIDNTFFVHNCDNAIETNARSHMGRSFPVTVYWSLVGTGDMQEKLYNVIITDKNNVREKSRLSKLKTSQRDKDLDLCLRDEQSYKKLLEFCIKESNSESILYLYETSIYKQETVENRVRLQYAIYETYIKYGSKHQLNISNDMIRGFEERLTRSDGNLDLFDNITEIVRMMVTSDIYPRFVKQKT